MTRARIKAFALGLAAALAASGPAVAQSEVAEQLRDRMEVFVTAYNAEDAAAIESIYADDAALLAPQSTAILGAPEIAGFYSAVFEQIDPQIRFRIDEVTEMDENTALMIGVAVIDFTTSEGVPARQISRSMHVWVKVDGEWRLQRDMYNIIARGPMEQQEGAAE